RSASRSPATPTKPSASPAARMSPPFARRRPKRKPWRPRSGSSSRRRPTRCGRGKPPRKTAKRLRRPRSRKRRRRPKRPEARLYLFFERFEHGGPRGRRSGRRFGRLLLDDDRGTRLGGRAGPSLGLLPLCGLGLRGLLRLLLGDVDRRPLRLRRPRIVADAGKVVGHRVRLFGAGGVVRAQEARTDAAKLARAAMAAGAGISEDLRGGLARVDVALGVGG